MRVPTARGPGPFCSAIRPARPLPRATARPRFVRDGRCLSATNEMLSAPPQTPAWLPRVAGTVHVDVQHSPGLPRTRDLPSPTRRRAPSTGLMIEQGIHGSTLDHNTLFAKDTLTPEAAYSLPFAKVPLLMPLRDSDALHIPLPACSRRSGPRDRRLPTRAADFRMLARARPRDGPLRSLLACRIVILRSLLLPQARRLKAILDGPAVVDGGPPSPTQTHATVFSASARFSLPKRPIALPGALVKRSKPPTVRQQTASNARSHRAPTQYLAACSHTSLSCNSPRSHSSPDTLSSSPAHTTPSSPFPHPRRTPTRPPTQHPCTHPSGTPLHPLTRFLPRAPRTPPRPWSPPPRPRTAPLATPPTPRSSRTPSPPTRTVLRWNRTRRRGTGMMWSPASRRTTTWFSSMRVMVRTPR